MRLKFTKMHGLGNDFVVFDGVRQPLSLSTEQIRFIADRHFGVGCDQILIVEKSSSPDVDFRYRIFNPDGGEVEQCGNGARCFTRFVIERGLTDKRTLRVETAAGVIMPTLEADGLVTVNMGAPRFEPHDIPFRAAARQPLYSLPIGDATRTFSVLSMGNPHAVQIVDDVELAPVLTEGPLIERHDAFPARVNAGFMQIVDRRNIKLRVFERGTGETLACGTGACAAVAAGAQLGLLDSEVTVQARGGLLKIRWTGEGQPVFLTGAGTTVFTGELNLE